MPKVEAKDHRHRGLLDRPLRLLRRARLQSRGVIEPEARKTHIDTGANEANQQSSLEFGEYNGWVNFPTWSVFTVMTSYEETYEALHRMSLQQPGGMGNVRRAVLGSVEHWKNDQPTPYAHAARILAQDFLMNGVRRVDWTQVSDTLQGERKELGETNELTTVAYNALAGISWNSIIEDAQYLTDADTMLRDWLQDQCITWVLSPDARAHTGSVGKFADTVLDIYFQAVQWNKVTAALRGE